MKKVTLIITIIFLVSLSVFAQDKNSKTSKLGNLTTGSKIDTIYVLQKKIYRTIKREPLKNKKYGVDINPIRLLLGGINEDLVSNSFSGGISLFNINRQAELYFPIYYYSKNHTYDKDSSYESSKDLHIFSIDCRYRYFLGNTQYGWFIGGFLRYANMGYKWTYKSEPNIIYHDNRIGLGMEIGYRIFSYKGLYWGISANIGRYVVADFSEDINSFDFQRFLYALEIFKIGWAF